MPGEIINHGLQGAGLEYVDRLTLDRAAPLAKRGHGHPELFRILIQEEDLRAVVGERVGDAEADTRRPAGHDSDEAANVEKLIDAQAASSRFQRLQRPAS